MTSPVRLAQADFADPVAAGRGMDHLPIACVDANMGHLAAGAGAKEQQIAGQYLALRLSSLKLRCRAPRHRDTSLPIGVLHQATAIDSTG